MSSSYSRWGERSVNLAFPFCGISFAGISDSQARDFGTLYGRFHRIGNEFSSDLICNCLPSTRAFDQPVEDFAVDGFYSPTIERDGSRLTISAYDFFSTIDFDTRPFSATLETRCADSVPRPDVSENFLRIFTAFYALHRNGIVLHSAGFVWEGMAYLFVGRSGAGKTTLTRKANAAGARILSDDLNMLVPSYSGYVASQVPFTGEFGRSVIQDEGQPNYSLGGLCILEQGAVLSIDRLSVGKAVSRLMVGAPFVNQQADMTVELLNSAESIVNAFPLYRLQTTKDSDIGDIMSLVTNPEQSLD